MSRRTRSRSRGKPIAFTAQQFAILRALLEAGGATLGREQLVSRTGALDDEPPSDRAIDLHVTRLRRRLGDDPRAPRYIEAVYGVGYRLAHGTGGVQQQLGADASVLLDALPDAVLVLDRALTIRFANRTAELLLGLPRASLAGQRCGAILACTSCGGLPLDGPRCIGRAAPRWPRTGARRAGRSCAVPTVPCRSACRTDSSGSARATRCSP